MDKPTDESVKGPVEILAELKDLDARSPVARGYRKFLAEVGDAGALNSPSPELTKIIDAMAAHPDVAELHRLTSELKKLQNKN